MLSRTIFKQSLAGGAVLTALLFQAGCINVKTHSTIEPIYMTLDVNLKVQLQEELNNAFEAIDAQSQAVNN